MLEDEERRRTFILDTKQDHGNTFFSASARQCNINFSVVHAQVCFKSVLFIIIVLSCRPE